MAERLEVDVDDPPNALRRQFVSISTQTTPPPLESPFDSFLCAAISAVFVSSYTIRTVVCVFLSLFA
ncbi:hypothetical protein L596_014785 [Steinernema carpocapsae]|uniref:Uncharacterized protein n=1 Tax=Steinernema carpocapsae TaxID=34508 RepID=A0A4U5NE45_STECR|nr:hypothetical protein L596_014785 [Steinernema carpocapsae]